MLPYFTDKGLSPAAAIAATTALFISGAMGSVAFGYLAEWFGIKRVITVNYLFMGLGFVILLMVDSPLGAILWGVYMGTLQGGGGTLNQVLFADYFVGGPWDRSGERSRRSSWRLTRSGRSPHRSRTTPTATT